MLWKDSCLNQKDLSLAWEHEGYNHEDSSNSLERKIVRVEKDTL